MGRADGRAEEEENAPDAPPLDPAAQARATRLLSSVNRATFAKLSRLLQTHRKEPRVRVAVSLAPLRVVGHPRGLEVRGLTHTRRTILF